MRALRIAVLMGRIDDEIAQHTEPLDRDLAHIMSIIPLGVRTPSAGNPFTRIEAIRIAARLLHEEP
ncbi:hypothetical protein [Archangium lansingense]|uniref:Uncharacterized protein n=1 Tax=Archangium lansingense TaxID=2995310 RepID=A0ABT4A1X8_9BACT|nr:hypothetical protein [Archangium lansinium]MCY1075623.1 hypothetical protein [Archangium lansinium]